MSAAANAQTWVARPAPENFARQYPAEALPQGVEGRAIIRCVVGADGRLRGCVVEEESPDGYGFGAAALGLGQKFRVSMTTRRGVSMIGARIGIAITWEIAD